MTRLVRMIFRLIPLDLMALAGVLVLSGTALAQDVLYTCYAPGPPLEEPLSASIRLPRAAVADRPELSDPETGRDDWSQTIEPQNLAVDWRRYQSLIPRSLAFDYDSWMQTDDVVGRSTTTLTGCLFLAGSAGSFILATAIGLATFPRKRQRAPEWCTVVYAVGQMPVIDVPLTWDESREMVDF